MDPSPQKHSKALDLFEKFFFSCILYIQMLIQGFCGGVAFSEKLDPSLVIARLGFISGVISCILLANLISYVHRKRLWMGKSHIDPKHFRVMWIIYSCALGLNILSFVLLIIFLSGADIYQSFLDRAMMVLALYMGGAASFLLSAYFLQFFQPTLRKRMIFDCVFFPAVIGWYVFLVRAVF